MTFKLIAVSCVCLLSSLRLSAQREETEVRNTNISFGTIRNAFFKGILNNERFDTMYYGQGITLHLVNYLVQKTNYQLGFGTGISMIKRTNQNDGYKSAQIPLYIANKVTLDPGKPAIPSILINMGSSLVVDTKHSPDKNSRYVSMSTKSFNRMEGFVELGVTWTTYKRLTWSLSFLYMSLGVKDLQADDFHDNVMLRLGYDL